MSSKTLQQILDYQNYEVNSRLNYFKPNLAKKQKSFAEEITLTLNQKIKSISPKFFYDDRGSELFEKICSVPEYYLTRTEIKILKQLQTEFHKLLERNYRLVELGSGSSVKTRLILDVLDRKQNIMEYFPIDISEILQESSQELLRDYKNLHITGVVDTYEAGLKFIKNFDNKPNLIAFLGSSLGNFCSECSYEFLNTINSTMKKSDLFMIGLDLIKDKKILEDAYNDSKGITAKFNLNVLSRINKELDGNFDIGKFSHHAFFNEDENRIEIYLKSKQKQAVKIQKANLSFDIGQDELIHTEHSHKYSLAQIKKMMNTTGFTINRIWKDAEEHYAIVLASKS